MDDTDHVDGSAQPSRRRQALGWLLTVVVAVAITLVIRTWAFQVYSIPSPSMVPTLDVGDRVAVSKFDRSPGRGDIIVFERPASDPVEDESDPTVLIKRVIGLPGETVDAHDGVVSIDGRPLAEPYLPKGTSTDFDRPIKVTARKLLVLGDNREISKDGRSFGLIDRDSVVGRAVLRIWPLSRIGGL